MNPHRSEALRLTEGSIPRKVIAFAIPLLLGNLFQQLYNTADTLIVGNFLGSDALAAVGSSGSLINLLIGLFQGVGIGAGVVISRYYGAKDFEKTQSAIHTLLASSLISGILLTFIGVGLSPRLLRWMGTPESVLPNSILYFRLYFAGILTIVLYNTSSAIFHAVGDSRHPLQYLIISSFLNIFLDLLFIVVFHFGIGSAAVATVIAQAFSAILSFSRLCRSSPEYRVSFRKIHIDLSLFCQIVRIGVPSGLQNSIISLANVVVQSHINAFGVMAMAGCGVYNKINGFAFLPISCFSLAMTTFIGQNLGAKEYERARKGARFGIFCAVSLGFLIGMLIYWQIPNLVWLFDRNPEVIAYGTLRARPAAAFMFLSAYSHVISGILRGAGKSTVPMFVMVFFWCIVRIIYITVMLQFIPDIRVVFSAYPVTWTLSSIVFVFYYRSADWVHGLEKA